MEATEYRAVEASRGIDTCVTEVPNAWMKGNDSQGGREEVVALYE
jgi:hypothetical protein